MNNVKKNSPIEFINIAGSIASISGISLVWIKQFNPNLSAPGIVLGLSSTIIFGLLTIGLGAFGIWSIRAIKAQINLSDPYAKIAYFGISWSIFAFGFLFIEAEMWALSFSLWFTR